MFQADTTTVFVRKLPLDTTDEVRARLKPPLFFVIPRRHPPSANWFPFPSTVA
jgi:hypothetical protein